MKKNVAIYARVSSAKQKEGENIRSQISCLVEYANNNEYVIPDGWTFADEGFSGSTLQRPSLEALRGIIQEGVVDIVLVYSPDRLSRKYAYQLLLEMEFQKRGTEINFINTPRASTPEEQLSVHFKGIFAEYERAQITERCRRGRLFKAKQGSVSVISTPPLGYDYIKKTTTSMAQYVINKDSQTVKDIFNLYVHGHLSLSKVCLELEKKGILSPKGLKKWNHSTVRDILKNEAYIGTAYFGKTEHSEGMRGRIYRTPKGEKRSVAISATKRKSKELWIPLNVPQIISESDFEVAQIKLETNIKMASRNTYKPSILQGLLICGHCGSPFYKKSRSKYSYYNCSKRIHGDGCNSPSFKQQELDELVWKHVIELLKDPRLIEQEIDRRENESSDSQKMMARINELNKDILRLDRAKDKLLDAYQESECLTLNNLKERLKDLDLKTKALLKEKASIEEFTVNELKRKNLKEHMARLQGHLESSEKLSVRDKQNVLRLLVSEIVITDQDVNIKHCIPCYEQNTSNFSPLCGDGYV